MIIKEIEINDNARLMICGTKRISLKFNEMHQLILGTNGCGKSTLIQELSPLPPSGNDYLKDGYKKIIIEHKGIDYLIQSTFNVKAGKHSLIIMSTGEELNSGGTQSVQRTLVKEIFDYDQSLHDVLTDQIRFTNMSPLQRRDWLTRMSGTNLDYAIELFNRLRRAQRDEEAVVKHLSSRLNKESDGLPTIQDIHDIEVRFNKLDKLVKELYTQRVNQSMPGPQTMATLFNTTVIQATELTKKLLRIDVTCMDENISNVDELNEQRSKIRNQLQVNKLRVIELYNEHTEISNLLSQTQEVSDEEQLKLLNLTLKELYSEINNLKSNTKLIHTCDNAMHTYGRAQGLSDAIYHLSTEFIDNTEGYFIKQKRMDAEANIDRLNITLNNLMRELKNVEHWISHIELSDDVSCPKCNHTFIPGIKAEDLPKLKDNRLKIENTIDDIKSEQSQYISYMQEYHVYRDNYIKYMNLLNSNKDLDFINDFIRPIDLIKESPNIISTTFARCLNDLSCLSKIEGYMPEVFRIEAIIDKVNSVKSNGNYTQSRIDKIDSDIENINKVTNTLNNKLNELDGWFNRYLEIGEVYKQLDSKLNELNEVIEYTYKSNKKDAIETTITKVNTDLAHVNMQLNEARNKQNIIDDITSQRDKTLNRSTGYKTLVDEINPTNGLIADYFKKFINQFVEQMNIIINKVWEHDIELLPCDVNSDGISYKFPLRINNKPYGPPDGSKGSNSQVSMINFAFKVVVMVYLGLDDYPLYLDELAPDLDEKHRINIISFVRSFIESGRCSQLFMVSHYASGYGAFVNAEILILDEENLLNVPPIYNEHVTLIKDK